MKRKFFKLTSFILCALLPLSACSNSSSSQQDNKSDTQIPKIDNTVWQYNADSDVYWQVGVSYCASPADKNYETLGVFVPAAYMEASANGDGTFTCTVNHAATVGDFTADTAPIVIPVNTPGYSAMAAPTGYSNDVAQYTSEGFVYVAAGCRGRDAGAPAGVTDLKAAIRYIRYSADVIPGDMERIFSFGMSGGGAQSALLGATGDSELYTPYLEAIGAVEGYSDAVCGSMCWCPITNLDYANEAYEWNLGSSRSGLDEETQALSDKMAEAFALYMNKLGLKDENGTVLTLTQSDDGIYQSGSYYDYLKSVIETSLEHFLKDTEFPYDASSAGSMGGGMMSGMGGMRGGQFGNGNADGNGKGFGHGDANGDRFGGNLPDGNLSDGELPNGELPDDFGRDLPDGNLGGFTDADGNFQFDGIDRTGAGAAGGGLSLSGTYETLQDYIDALNSENEWISYDAATNTVTITSVADFVNAMKNASKSVGAFDDLNGSQGENTLFGYGDNSGAHFDPTMAEILAELDSSYADSYAADLKRTDSLGNTVDVRMNMYNPLYYLCDYYEGAGSSNVASYWRIRTGIEQGDTAVTTEVNLALALENTGKTVDFETIWGQGHTQAERTGTATANFIEWVKSCLV